jgi:hypothetical protein
MPVIFLTDLLSTGGHEIGRGVLGPDDSMALTFDLRASRVQTVGGRVLNCSQHGEHLSRTSRVRWVSAWRCSVREPNRRRRPKPNWAG